VAFTEQYIAGTCNEVTECVFEIRIREKVVADVMQFGFWPGKGTTDTIFVVRQMQEKHRDKGKKVFILKKHLTEYLRGYWMGFEEDTSERLSQ